MAHLVGPASYRAGKTQPWASSSSLFLSSNKTNLVEQSSKSALSLEEISS